MSRSTSKNFDGAYRVVTKKVHKETGKQVGELTYTGPYQTKGAAKAMLTRMTWEYNYYGQKKTELVGEIQIATGWEAVEL